MTGSVIGSPPRGRRSRSKVGLTTAEHRCGALAAFSDQRTRCCERRLPGQQPVLGGGDQLREVSSGGGELFNLLLHGGQNLGRTAEMRTLTLPTEATEDPEICSYLEERTDRRLENQVGVEQEGAQEGLRERRQLGQDARQQQVGLKRVGQHVLHAGQQHADERTCGRRNGGYALGLVTCGGNAETPD